MCKICSSNIKRDNLLLKAKSFFIKENNIYFKDLPLFFFQSVDFFFSLVTILNSNYCLMINDPGVNRSRLILIKIWTV